LEVVVVPRTKKDESFTEFFSDVEVRLRAAFTATFGVEIGREICADTMAYGWEHWDRLREMANPAGYLYRVGVGKGRRTSPSFRVVHEPVAIISPDWFEPGLVGALETLSERQRIVVSLVHGYGWSMTEVGDLLGVGKSTVQSYEQRGMKRLRRKLGVK
jgi:RNA polymerase sigma factor (sigma-70 family)